ncbi:MAG: exopolysaccharide biosynthesis polyprenyl glycosylphosphotransferase [Lachnospiraceae bacterium]|nr:exopolysaccharide biosynthesis polyprenyl glycosylphosphotransferase [Lachnospiraceae bacterium]
MKKFCLRFQNSIRLLFELLIYGGSFFLLFALLGIENRQVCVLSRTSVIMTIMYIMAVYLLTRIYGGFVPENSSSRSNTLSVGLPIMFSSCASYVIFLIMSVNDANARRFQFKSFGYFFASLVLSGLFSAFIVGIGDRFYRWLLPPERAIVIISKAGDEAEVRRVIAAYGKRYQIESVRHFDAPDIHSLIKGSDAAFFYDVPPEERWDLVNYCYKHRINVYLNPEIADVVEMASKQMLFMDVPFLVHAARKMTFEQRVVKRLLDIFLPLIGLIVTSPILLLAVIMIKLDDGGSVFFKQKRATINGRVFEIIKFRTMREDAGVFSATKGDDRITRAGRFLRKYRIDELPQLINIIRGDMSLVGPRPEMLENVNEYEKELPEFRYRLRMKAGLTGYAQIVGRYNTSSRDKLILDLIYIENFSILLDIKLLFQTVLVLFNAEDSTEGFKRDKCDES